MNVYDVSSYYNSKVKFLGPNMEVLFSQFYGQDATKQYLQLKRQDPNATMYLNCMNNMFYIGAIDQRASVNCVASNMVLLIFTSIIVFLLVGKFMSAISCGFGVIPEEIDKYVIIQIPVYTESQESISQTLSSLAKLEYRDDRMLLFIVVDGLVVGHGNDLTSDQIVFQVLGLCIDSEPAKRAYECLGSGDLRLNHGTVHSGYYSENGRQIPFVVVVKVGNESETVKPGNRGKRDSQMVLMRFLSRAHYQDAMSPLELGIYEHFDGLKIDPNSFEFVLMVDSDTEVLPDSLKHLISSMCRDVRIIGLCGETLISNSKQSWVSMIQVYEYFISHHLSKSFESLFGSVTCIKFVI
jgi:chitin synthase